MQRRRQGQGLLIRQGGADGGVQMHQLAVAGQARMAWASRHQSRLLQHFGDRFHHQFVLAEILVGARQLLGLGTDRSCAGQGIAAQLALAHCEQPFRGGPEQGGAIGLLPQETAAAGLALAQLRQQLQGVERALQQELLAYRQHQLAQAVLLNQLYPALHHRAIALLPGGAAGDRRTRRMALIGIGV